MSDDYKPWTVTPFVDDDGQGELWTKSDGTIMVTRNRVVDIRYFGVSPSSPAWPGPNPVLEKLISRVLGA